MPRQMCASLKIAGRGVVKLKSNRHMSRLLNIRVLLYGTKFQLRNRTTFFWLRLLLPFFFYYIDAVGVYVVSLFPKKTAQKRRRSSVPKLQQAQSGCLCPTGRFKKKSVWIKRKTQPVEPVSSQNLSFWRFEALLNQNACFWGLTQITDFLIPLNFYFPFSEFIDPVRCSYLGVSDVFLTHFWSGSSAYQ